MCSNEEEIGELKGNTSSTLDGGFDGQDSNHKYALWKDNSFIVLQLKFCFCVVSRFFSCSAKKAVEHASERVAKIKKRIVLGSELDEKIRNLYEKYVCSNLLMSTRVSFTYFNFSYVCLMQDMLNPLFSYLGYPIPYPKQVILILQRNMICSLYFPFSSYLIFF